MDGWMPSPIFIQSIIHSFIHSFIHSPLLSSPFTLPRYNIYLYDPLRFDAIPFFCSLNLVPSIPHHLSRPGPVVISCYTLSNLAHTPQPHPRPRAAHSDSPSLFTHIQHTHTHTLSLSLSLSLSLPLSDRSSHLLHLRQALRLHLYLDPTTRLTFAPWTGHVTQSLVHSYDIRCRAGSSAVRG